MGKRDEEEEQISGGRAFREKDPRIVERERRGILEESEAQNVYECFLPNNVSDTRTNPQFV